MIIAHRGFYDKFVPENSMTAFIRCIEKKLPIELDIRLTKDKQIIVFHDENLFRMTGVNKKVEDTTYNEIKKLHLKKTKEKIPLLKEVLEKINRRVFLLIELKNKKVGELEDKVNQITLDYKNLAFQTFNLKSALYLKNITNFKVGHLTFKKINLKALKKLDFISHSLLDLDKVKINKPLYAFTINNKEELNKASKYSNYLITNVKNLESSENILQI